MIDTQSAIPASPTISTMPSEKKPGKGYENLFTWVVPYLLQHYDLILNENIVCNVGILL